MKKALIVAAVIGAAAVIVLGGFFLIKKAVPAILCGAVEPTVYTEPSGELKRTVKRRFQIVLPDSTADVSGEDQPAFRDPSFSLDFTIDKEDFDGMLDRGRWIAVTRKYEILSEEESWNGTVHEIYKNQKESLTYLRCYDRGDGTARCQLRYGWYLTAGWFDG